MAQGTKKKRLTRLIHFILSWKALHNISAILLVLLLVAYAAIWVDGNSRALFDPHLQNDDARIHAMPMHRHDGVGTLKNNDIALDMLAYSTLVFRVLYMVLVPTVGLFAAPKVVQMICWLIVTGCIIQLARSKKAGLACGILLGFFFLHTDFIVDRMAGGLQRNFAFPVIAMWLTGCLTGSTRLRRAAALLGVITYPASFALVIASEGIYILRNGINLASPAFRKSIITYILLVIACVALTRVDAMTKPYRGKLPTYKEAASNPAFRSRGRTKQVPFKDPTDKAIKATTEVFSAGMTYKSCRPSSSYQSMGSTGPMVIISLLVLLSFSRLSPRPVESTALLCSSIFLYSLARLFAFRLLYIPDRYLMYGMTAFAITLAITSIGRIFPDIQDTVKRNTARNIVAIVMIATIVSITGDRIVENKSVKVDRSEFGLLWDFILTLPKETKISAHPIDADGIAFWTGRASTPGDEQLLPWLDEAWERNKALTQQTIKALYATERNTLISYCQENKITHILLNTNRYKENFPKMAKTIEPFGAFATKITAQTKLKKLVLTRVPKDSVIFINEEYKIIDVSLLTKCWKM